MAMTYIAFIECVLRPFGHWEKKTGRDIHIPKGKDAEMALVDIKNDRRYFRFINHNTEVRIVSNTVVFESEDVEEFSVDESIQFPKKKGIGD